MPGLRDIQTLFADHLFGREKNFAQQFVRINGLAADKRLQIYHNNVVIGLMQTLHSLYPVVAKLVGDDYFRQAARHYVKHHPSRSGSILDYGDQFPQFLQSAPGLETLPYIAEIARLEWKTHRVFHAADAPILDPANFADVAPTDYPQLKIELHAASHLAESLYPLFNIWQFATGRSKRERIDLASGPSWLLVLRRDLAIELFRLSEGEHALLSGMSSGMPLERCVESAVAVEPEFDLQSVLARHLQLGTFTGFSMPKQ